MFTGTEVSALRRHADAAVAIANGLTSPTYGISIRGWDPARSGTILDIFARTLDEVTNICQDLGVEPPGQVEGDDLAFGAIRRTTDHGRIGIIWTGDDEADTVPTPRTP